MISHTEHVMAYTRNSSLQFGRSTAVDIAAPACKSKSEEFADRLTVATHDCDDSARTVPILAKKLGCAPATLRRYLTNNPIVKRNLKIHIRPLRGHRL